MVCQHEKVYDNKILLSYPSQIRWICMKCGKQGTDIFDEDIKSVNEYNELMKKFSKEDRK